MTRNKYNVAPPEERTYKGWLYDSKAEKRYAEQLDMAPDVVWWMRQPRFDLGEDIRYAADFLVVERDRSGTVDLEFIHVVDVKGKETAKFRMFKRLWPKYGPVPLKLIRFNYKTKQFATYEVVTPYEGTSK